ncbi:MAG TPA: hypothetical protein VFN78_00195, partial [Ktedonobacterales bacterium]|nr:hypothetical protein [Ktedonobacterales bacterium]
MAGGVSVVIEQRESPEPANGVTHASTTQRGGGRWRWRLAIAVTIAVYYLFWAVTAFDKVNPTDLDVFFLPAT